MTVLLGISKTFVSEKLGESFWCAYKRHQLVPGDLIYIYVKAVGISQLFEVVKLDTPWAQFKCEMRGMLTVWLKHIVTFKKPLDSKALHTHPILRESNVVRRNFQGTSFVLEPNDCAAISEILFKLNPDQLEYVGYLNGQSK